MRSLRKRLSKAEEQFLLAIIEGPSAVEAFDQSWSVLLCDINEALESGRIDEDTALMAQAVSSRIEILADTSHTLLQDIDSLTHTMVDEVEGVLSSQRFSGDSPSAFKMTSTSSDRSSAKNALPNALGYSACSWVIAHLSNPYPSAAQKRAIARQLDVEVKTVSTCFKDVRSRIGWTALCRDYFYGSRTKIIDAAASAFTDGTGASSISDDLLSRFIIIESNALRLFESFGVESSTIVKFESDVPWPAFERNDPVPDDTPQPQSIRRDSSVGLRSIRCLPSLTFSSSVESGVDEVDLPSILCRKRSISVLNDENEDTDCRVKKRCRKDDEIDIVHINDPPSPTCLSESTNTVGRVACHSPPSSSGPVCKDCDTSLPSVIERKGQLTQASHLQPVVRKRSLSNVDFEDEPDAKRLRGCPVVSRSVSDPQPVVRKRSLSNVDLEAEPDAKRLRGCPVVSRSVSDPLPSRADMLEEQTVNINDWYSVVFNLPARVSFAEPDPSIPLDVEIFNDWASVDRTEVGELNTSKPIESLQPPYESIESGNVEEQQPHFLPLDGSPVLSATDSNNFCESVELAFAALPDTSSGDNVPVDSAVVISDVNAPMPHLGVSDMPTREDILPPPWVAPTSIINSTTHLLRAAADLTGTSSINDTQYRAIAKPDLPEKHRYLWQSETIAANKAGDYETCRWDGSQTNSPPPPFTEDPDILPPFGLNPPRYTSFDQFPETGWKTPPPPYCRSPYAPDPLIVDHYEGSRRTT